LCFAFDILNTGLSIGVKYIMFCPNCGSKNGVEQHYCRECGLKLDAIAEAVAAQYPSNEYGALQRRKERFEKLGVLSL